MILNSVLDKHMPIKKIRTKTHQKPWVSNEFLSLIDTKEYRAKQYRKNPTEENKNALKLAKKQVCQLKKALKKSYIETTLTRPRNDPKKLWRSIRTFWPNSKTNNSYINCINSITEEAEIANLMNKFFCERGKRIQEQINTNATLKDFPYQHLPPIFEFQEITVKDITDVITSLSSSPASSVDQITTLMLKSAKTELAPILQYLFKLS